VPSLNVEPCTEASHHSHGRSSLSLFGWYTAQLSAMASTLGEMTLQGSVAIETRCQRTPPRRRSHRSKRYSGLAYRRAALPHLICKIVPPAKEGTHVLRSSRPGYLTQPWSVHNLRYLQRRFEAENRGVLRDTRGLECCASKARYRPRPSKQDNPATPIKVNCG
jgi:hypothetical protein